MLHYIKRLKIYVNVNQIVWIEETEDEDNDVSFRVLLTNGKEFLVFPNEIEEILSDKNLVISK